MRGMSIYCTEHYHDKETRAITGEPWYQEKRHRSKFGDSNHDAKPVGITPPVEISHPKDIPGHLHQTRSQTDKCEKERNKPEQHFFHNSPFGHISHGLAAFYFCAGISNLSSSIAASSLISVNFWIAVNGGRDKRMLNGNRRPFTLL